MELNSLRKKKKLKSILKKQRLNVLRNTECNKLNATSIETNVQATCINKMKALNIDKSLFHQLKVAAAVK